MSKNATQSYSLFQLLKAGTVVQKEVIASKLGIKLMSVPVYIHELKKQHKAEVIGVREGRKVVGYKLISKTVEVPQYRKNRKSVAKVKAVKNVALISEDGELPNIDKDAEITQIGEREFADITDSLGIGSGHSFE